MSAFLLVGLVSISQVQSPESEKLVVASSLNGDTFGGPTTAGALWMVTAAVGDVAGAVHVFRRTSAGHVHMQELEPPVGLPGDLFGWDVYLDGAALAIGAPGRDTGGGVNAGSVFVYADVSGSLALEQEITSQLSLPGDGFGQSVAIDGTTLVVGAPPANGTGTKSGAAYHFERSGTTWTEIGSVNGSQWSFGGIYGTSLDLDGNRLAVGAPREFGISTGSGAVYVFERSGSRFVEAARLAVLDGEANDHFGMSVALQGDTLVVGASLDDGLAQNSGSVWVYEWDGATWQAEAQLVSGNALIHEGFGYSVGLDRDVCVVGSYAQPWPTQRRTHVFRRQGSTWSLTDLLVPSSGPPDDLFGEFVAIYGNTVFSSARLDDDIAVNSGALYVHYLSLPPEPYCTGKTTTQGCEPSVSAAGSPTLTGPDDFRVQADLALPQKPGLFFWGLSGPAALPFQGGTLCVLPPLTRTPVQLSGGAGACGGTYDHPFTQAEMSGKGLYPGAAVHGQYWMRDPGQPDGTGIALSNAIEVWIEP